MSHTDLLYYLYPGFVQGYGHRFRGIKNFLMTAQILTKDLFGRSRYCLRKGGITFQQNISTAIYRFPPMRSLPFYLLAAQVAMSANPACGQVAQQPTVLSAPSYAQPLLRDITQHQVQTSAKKLNLSTGRGASADVEREFGVASLLTENNVHELPLDEELAEYLDGNTHPTPRDDKLQLGPAHTNGLVKTTGPHVEDIALGESDRVVLASVMAGESCCEHEVGQCVIESCHTCSVQCAWPGANLNSISLFAGAHGFKNAVNRGDSGSFGFHEGVNWGFPLSGQGHVSLQAGLRVVQSDFSSARFTEEGRNQVFVTLGGFRRVDAGLQGGVVVDFLNDNWYLNTDLVQLRGELSYAMLGQHDIGVWFATSTNSDVTNSRLLNGSVIEEGWETMDIYAAFYRQRIPWCVGGNMRLFAGFTGKSDGYIGADSRVPLTDKLAAEASFAYAVPDESTSSSGHEHEAWNVGIGIAWYPGGRCRNKSAYYNRPMFNVADNGTLIVRRR